MSATTAILRAGTVLALTAVTVLAGATAALAHVTVSSPDAAQGGYATVTIQVPNESDTASTVGVKVQLPTDTPLAYVGIQPKADWTYTAEEQKLPTPVATNDEELTEAVSVIDWKTAGEGIKAGEFDTFTIVVGPMPEQDSITFKAIQSYSDGKVVQWVEESTGATEPDYPAPTLALAAAAADGDHHFDGSGQNEDTETVAAASSTDSGGNGLAVTGVILGALGLVAGGGALAIVLRRRSATPAA